MRSRLAFASIAVVLLSCGNDPAPKNRGGEAPQRQASEGTTSVMIRGCDRQAGHPSDQSKPPEIYGVAEDRRINTEQALRLCAAAINESPNTPRLHFQYGRALFALGKYEDARARFHMAAIGGHGLSRQYFKLAGRRLQSDRRTAHAREQPSRKNPHEQFEREIKGVAAAGLGLLALGLASDAMATDRPAKPLPAGATPQQCAAALQQRTLYCQPDPEYTETGLYYTFACDSRWRRDNNACLPRFNGPNIVAGRAYYCDPISKASGVSRESVVRAVCAR